MAYDEDIGSFLFGFVIRHSSFVISGVRAIAKRVMLGERNSLSIL